MPYLCIHNVCFLPKPTENQIIPAKYPTTNQELPNESRSLGVRIIPSEPLFFWSYFPQKTFILGFSARSAEFFLGFLRVIFGVFRPRSGRQFFLELFLGFRREAPKNAKNSVFQGGLKFFGVFFGVIFWGFAFFLRFRGVFGKTGKY